MPRSSRALLSAEIRTTGEPGFAGADALMGFVPAKREPRDGREDGCPSPPPGRVGKPDSEESRPLSDAEYFHRAADHAPRSTARLRLGIHQDLSSGSPENSDVLIGNPIRK
jgi:hypothetical protein